jgi:hypothetical protein
MTVDGRTLIIGDVHGCYAELDDLLAVLDPQADQDRLLFVGDLINRGPSSREVWLRAKAWNAACILGNHEWALLQQLNGNAPSGRLLRTMRQDFGEAFDAFAEDVRTWPAYLEGDGWLMVHAGVVPGQTPRSTEIHQLVNIRTWDGLGLDLQNPANPPWFECYEDNPVVVFGHWAALGGVCRPNAIGIDTGCVYGGRLTALVWPDRRCVSVPARRTYAPI